MLGGCLRFSSTQPADQQRQRVHHHRSDPLMQNHSAVDGPLFFSLSGRMNTPVNGVNSTATTQEATSATPTTANSVKQYSPAALYRLMFGGYLTGPDDGRPAIEIAAAEKTKSLLAEAIIDGALGRAIPNTPRNERKIAGAILIFWSQMHGLTLLLNDRLVGPRGKWDKLTECALQGMLDGLATRIPLLARRHVDRSPSACEVETSRVPG